MKVDVNKKVNNKLNLILKLTNPSSGNTSNAISGQITPNYKQKILQFNKKTLEKKKE